MTATSTGVGATSRSDPSSADLLRRLVEGHGGVDQLQPVLHLQHQLLPVDGHLLRAVAYRLWIVVSCLQHHLEQEMDAGSEGGGDGGRVIMLTILQLPLPSAGPAGRSDGSSAGS